MNAEQTVPDGKPSSAMQHAKTITIKVIDRLNLHIPPSPLSHHHYDLGFSNMEKKGQLIPKITCKD